MKRKDLILDGGAKPCRNPHCKAHTNPDDKVCYYCNWAAAIPLIDKIR